ncbi:hypothetical protein, partial [Escherichia coli]|uniref:hypothetical protein n=1 Tax=Escherichia coli TaxID=562 RepID=UPI001C60E6D9
FSQKQKTKNSNLKFVIPTKAGIQFLEFQSFPINYLSIECLDSRLRGNDDGRSWWKLWDWWDWWAEARPTAFFYTIR